MCVVTCLCFNEQCGLLDGLFDAARMPTRARQLWKPSSLNLIRLQDAVGACCLHCVVTCLTFYCNGDAVTKLGARASVADRLPSSTGGGAVGLEQL
jgi:hypothetical protein